MVIFSDEAKALSKEFARANSLNLTPIDIDGIALNGNGYYHFFGLDHAGANMWYVDCEERLSYGLGMFLFECRMARVVPFDQASGLVPDCLKLQHN